MTLFTTVGDLIKARLDWYRLDLLGLAVRGPAAPSLALIFATKQGLNVRFWRGISLAHRWLFYPGDPAHLLSSSPHSSHSLSQLCPLTFISACRVNSRSSIYWSSVVTMTSAVTLNTSTWCSCWHLGHDLSTCLAGVDVFSHHSVGFIKNRMDGWTVTVIHLGTVTKVHYLSFLKSRTGRALSRRDHKATICPAAYLWGFVLVSTAAEIIKLTKPRNTHYFTPRCLTQHCPWFTRKM